MWFPHKRSFLFPCLIVLHTPASPPLWSPDNPRLPSCGLTLISIFSCHTPPRSVPAFFTAYPFIRWSARDKTVAAPHNGPPCVHCCRCLPFCRRLSPRGRQKNNLTLTEVPLFLYTLCIPDHLCVGFVVIECKLVGSTHLSLMQQKERAWIFLHVQQLGLRSPWQWHFIPFECSLLRYTFP